jgi:DNA modification methylase
VAGSAHQRLVHADALDLVRALEGEGLAGSIDLVYVDPPYASQTDYVLEARLDGRADGRVKRSLAYADTWSEKDGGGAAYLDMLAPRLDALCSLLSERGTVWVHLDWRSAYLVRVVLDEILGRDAFLNEIVWRRAPNLGRQAASSQFGRTLDTIVVYGKPRARLVPPLRLEPIEQHAIRWDDEGRPFTSAPRGDYTDLSIAKLEKEGRVHRTASGKVYIKYFLVKDAEGRLCRERRVDTLWTDVAPLRHAAASERSGFPTQKPQALLERIITCATEPGALVVDAFAGSGTTGCAAHAVGRRAVLGDRSAASIAVARSRLLRAGAGVSLERIDQRAPVGAEPLVRARRTGDRVAVELVEPAEPLAWAVGVVEDGVFCTKFHSERGLGKSPRPVETTCAIEAPPKAVVAARVYADDGSVAERALTKGARPGSRHQLQLGWSVSQDPRQDGGPG